MGVEPESDMQVFSRHRQTYLGSVTLRAADVQGSADPRCTLAHAHQADAATPFAVPTGFSVVPGHATAVVHDSDLQHLERNRNRLKLQGI